MELTAIKVIIGRKSVGSVTRNAWPDFNAIDATIRGSQDWSHYIDTLGLAWHYDVVAPFGQSDSESPNPLEMFVVTAVPDDFAQEAVRLFPAQVEILDETEFARLYDDRARVDDADALIDPTIVDGIRAKYGIIGDITDPAALAQMTVRERAALDPEDPTPGIVDNKAKTWAKYKPTRGATIRPKPSPAPAAGSPVHAGVGGGNRP